MKMCLRLVKIFLIIFLLIMGLFNVLIMNSNCASVQLWLKKGVYVEYREDYAAIEFLNDTEILPFTLNFTGDGETIFRWECLKVVNDSFVELRVSISLVEGSKGFNVSTCVFVDVESRDVYTVDGKYCGKTSLWLPTDLDEGDTVVFGINESLVKGTVTDVDCYMKTPYGYQKVFDVEFETKEPVNVTYGNETYRYKLWNWLSYDLDTGILLGMAGLRAEGVLFALGIWMLPSLSLIYETNVDLGPSLIWPQILNIMFFVLPPAVFFVVVFFAVYWRRRKRRRIVRRRER